MKVFPALLLAACLWAAGCSSEPADPATATGGAGSGAGGTSGPGGTTNLGGTAGVGGTGGACEPAPGCTLSPPASTGDLNQDCVNRINQFRQECLCLAPLERWVEGESCADMQAKYDSTNGAHTGFIEGICDGGIGQNECPAWHSAESVIDSCLQKMWDEGPPPTQPCLGSCFQEHGHYVNMTNPRHVRVACGFYATEQGEVWAVQNFAP